MIEADRLQEARGAFVSFLGSTEDKITVLHDFDADGVTAGVILVQALFRAGRERVGVSSRTVREARGAMPIAAGFKR